ncbi:recombinase family protein [Halalkalibacterium halodurans]|uniref:recombinase family protein n=1 Tax=Halalkalibacterium halodurans TaxID=86665 RepID=UPI0010FE85D6|nr:recombinase family protein [Halalkalibacterium halodurans]
MPKAVGYVRVSTDKQLDNTSIEKQIEEIEKYCEREGLTLVQIYNEGAKSAENIRYRSVFKQMYADVLDKESNIDYVIVFKADRISRDNLESLYIFKRLTQAKKHLICLADNIDTRDPKAKLLYQIMSLVSELERDMIKLRTTSGMERRATEGKHNGGKVFGYTTKNKELKVVPEEAKVVKFIFKKYAIDQWGYRKIASHLNVLGKTTKNNKHWSITAVKTILTNRIYIGDIKWRNEYRKGKHSAIIDMELWEQTQKMLKVNSHIQEKVHPGNYPLSGLIKCPECGAPMVQGNSSPKYKYYQCSKNKNSGKKACSSNLVKKEYAEHYVYEQVFYSLKSINIVEPLLKMLHSFAMSEIEPLEEKIKAYQLELRQLKEKRKELISWKLKDIITEVILKEEMHDIQIQENLTLKHIDNLQQQIRLRDKTHLSSIIKNSFQDFKTFFDLIEDEDKKKILRSLIKEIHVNPGEKTKDRTIKEIIYAFDLEYLSQVI